MQTLSVRVVPRSNRNEIGGSRGERVVVRVTAPPVDGKANAAACKVIAEAVGIPRSRVTVIRGATSRDKLLGLEGVSAEELERALDERRP